jgi:PAS domain S-box-containing protein
MDHSDHEMLAVLLKAGKARILAASAVMVALTALLDWAVGGNVSLAVLYILPMMLAAVVLRPWETAIAALFCSYLRFRFDTAGSMAELTLRFAFASAAYFLSGLFVTVLVRNHELMIQHLASIQVEQNLRREAEEQLRLLAESSPAAILTTDGRGVILAGNTAAETLFSIPDGQTLRDRNIGKYLPVLVDALRLDVAREGFRTAAKCQGYRENGDIFLAHIWFSSYTAPDGPRLAAIIVDASEEMRDQEEQGWQQLMRGNRIAAAAVAHEVRNFCGAIALRCGNLRDRYGLSDDPDFQGLSNLVGGLESIASLELLSKSQEELERVQLRDVLNDLRILIETDWREIEGVVRWHLPDTLPSVIAEPHGLLQACLNLAQNSHRAVQQSAARELNVRVSGSSGRVFLRFQDSGPGISAPDQLFQPFQKGASGTGMGLYVSRVIVRSYGGDLRYEPQPSGSCFAIELEAV